MEAVWMLCVSIALASTATFSQGENLVVCENTARLNIFCGDGEIIHIKAANYGRTVPSRKVCAYSAHHQDRTDCVSPGSEVKVSRACNGRQHCSVPASNRYFGDPCRGTYKYLNVSYQCTRDNLLACENAEPLNIFCGHGEFVRIMTANYGRTVSSHQVCPYSYQHEDRTDCVSASSERKVIRACIGQQHCSVPASDAFFGDPCRGTYKYLNVTYQCIPPL